MKKTDCIKKVIFYVDVSEQYPNLNELEYASPSQVIKALRKLPILDYEVTAISEDEAEVFETE